MTPVLILGGPTGGGKNHAALEFASHHPCELINADSRQVYRGMRIGTNQPSPRELEAAPHHLFGFLHPREAFSMADYERLAYPLIHDILSRGRIPVVVGGTGFYIKALIKGVWPVPRHNPDLRARLRRIQARAPERLFALLLRNDPASAVAISRNDHYRVLRALEIYYQTGKRRSELVSPGPDRFPVARFFLDPDLVLLEQNIRARTDAMFQEGWVQEVRDLVEEHPDFDRYPAARALGYQEVLRHLAGEMSLEACCEAVCRKTLQYAKRQRTWFRNQDGFVRVSTALELRQKIDSVLQ